ncbi:cytochrome c550 [Bacillus testis]|uniref:cytochrome c550 n=1 Tax=Bacillus testis TaxID=1622072 RepID=UPI00067F705D|nr:cytochrome c [Bacillus testis]
MNRSPIIPFVMIMVAGIVLIFALSFKGLGDAKDVAEGKDGKSGEKTETTAKASPEEFYKETCISCHGDQYQGVVGPALKGIGKNMSKDEIKDVLKNGKKGPKGEMPGGLVPDDKLDEMTTWLSKL